MLPSEVPACRCGAQSWRSGGGYMGALVQEQFWCTLCDAGMCVVHHEGGALAVVVGASSFAQQAVHDYINTKVMPVWRTRAKARRDARDTYVAEGIKVINRELGLPEETLGDTVPESVSKQWCAMVEELDRRARRNLAPELRADPLPPQMPAEMRAYVRGPEGWTPVDPATTRDLPVPPDPIRVGHDAYFTTLFDELERALETKIERQEVPNQYYRDAQNLEPWYQFTIGSGSFVVGPRKRVVSIEARSETPFDVAALRASAKAKGVTYEADDGYQSDAARASRVLVHAWGQEQCVEFLTLLGRAVRSS